MSNDGLQATTCGLIDGEMISIINGHLANFMGSHFGHSLTKLTIAQDGREQCMSFDKQAVGRGLTVKTIFAARFKVSWIN